MFNRFKLKKYTAISLIAIALSAVSAIAVADNEKLPQYKDYAVTDIYKQPNAPVNFADNKKAQPFHKILQQASKFKPNFAGQYILTSWGCGMFCLQMGIIDAKTGKVALPEPKLPAHWNKYLVGWTYEKPRVDSQLLIINAQLTTIPRDQPNSLKGPLKQTKAYYQWKNDQLKLLAFS